MTFIVCLLTEQRFVFAIFNIIILSRLGRDQDVQTKLNTLIITNIIQWFQKKNETKSQNVQDTTHRC